MSLPTEVLLMAFKYMTKPDLKKLRLVCKQYSNAAIPVLYDKVFLSTNRADAEVTVLIIRHFAPYVKTLIFSSVLYDYMTYAQWRKRYGQRKRSFNTQREKDDFIAHCQYVYENYFIIRQELQEDIRSGVCLAHLCRALQGLPNLRKVIVTDGGPSTCEITSSSRESSSRGLWRKTDPCLVADCKLSNNEHLRYQMLPNSGFLSLVVNPWEMLQLAMWTTSRVIEDISVQPDISVQKNGRGLGQNGPYLPDLLMPNPYRPYEICDVMRNLTKFRLDVYYEGNYESDPYSKVDFAGPLSAATNLKALYLGFTSVYEFIFEGQYRIFLGFLRNCRLPNLESLILSHINSTAEELLSFLRESRQLRQLTLQPHRLYSSTWEAVANELRGLKSLKSVQLTELKGGWSEDSMASFDAKEYDMLHGAYQDVFGDVEGFLFRNEPNPFTETAMTQYFNDLVLGTRPIKPHDGQGVRLPGPETRYKLFH
ncbi:hypothetical protein ACLMJK_003937 [Lecanora helva]